MAAVAGIMNGGYVSSLRNAGQKKKKKSKAAVSGGLRINCVSTPIASDPYKTLRIHPNASESEVKKAFRQLALQYHPDVCRGSNCGIQFSQINEAYDVSLMLVVGLMEKIVMSNLRNEPNVSEMDMYGPSDAGIDEPMRGMDDPDWDLWEEWMGWEGAGIRDYSSHINPYI